MESAGLDENSNRWDLVFDFTQTDESGNKIENFHTLEPAQFSIVTKEVEGDETAPSILPLPHKYGGELDDNDTSEKQNLDGMAEFDIHTSAAEAQQKFEEMEIANEEPVVENEEPVVENEEPVVENEEPGASGWADSFQPPSEPMQMGEPTQSYAFMGGEPVENDPSADVFGDQVQEQFDDGLDDDEREHLKVVQAEQEV